MRYSLRASEDALACRAFATKYKKVKRAQGALRSFWPKPQIGLFWPWLVTSHPGERPVLKAAAVEA